VPPRHHPQRCAERVGVLCTRQVATWNKTHQAPPNGSVTPVDISGERGILLTVDSSTQWTTSYVSQCSVIIMRQLFSAPQPEGRWAVPLFVGIVLAFCFAGCGGSDIGRRPVFGLVQGAQGQTGTVTFIPVGEPGRPSATADIEDGRYEFDGSNGPCSGQHQVHIRLRQSPEASPQEPEPKSDKILKVDRRRKRVFEAPAPIVEKTVELNVPEDGPWKLDIQLP